MASATAKKCIHTETMPIRVKRSHLLLPVLLRTFFWLTLSAGAAGQAYASLTLLVGEPFGSFGTMMPVGHTAIYLDHVCADGPLKLRICQAGELAGVVVARYHAMGPYDWMATPIMQFLYAVDTPEEVPAYVTSEGIWEMRQAYRRRFLLDIVPDGKEKNGPVSEWWETAGMAYNRRVWGYRFDTTEQQDERFVYKMNADANRHRYHLHHSNCADFAADIVNFYIPGTVRVNHVADFGLMTPKNVARSVEAYGVRHPEAHPEIIEISQVAGALRRSRPVRGVAEGLLKTKRYLATLLAIQPEVPVVLTCMYLKDGRWQMGRNATVETPSDLIHQEASGGNVVAAR